MGSNVIRTTPQGYLSRSKVFKENAEQQEYKAKDMEMENLFNIQLSDLYCSVRTDGGKEFMAKPITDTIESYGYHHEKTAADTSF